MTGTIIVNNRGEYKFHSTYVLKYSYQINGVRGGAVRWGTAGSIPGGVIGIFHWTKLSGRTMDLGRLNI